MAIKTYYAADRLAVDSSTRVALNDALEVSLFAAVTTYEAAYMHRYTYKQSSVIPEDAAVCVLEASDTEYLISSINIDTETHQLGGTVTVTDEATYEWMIPVENLYSEILVRESARHINIPEPEEEWGKETLPEESWEKE